MSETRYTVGSHAASGTWGVKDTRSGRYVQTGLATRSTAARAATRWNEGRPAQRARLTTLTATRQKDILNALEWFISRPRTALAFIETLHGDERRYARGVWKQVQK
jgi:hypothetical protein